MPRAIRRSDELPPRLDDLPLDGEELLFLDRFLAEEGEEAGSVMALDGLITALEVVPGPPLQALWDGWIFGGYDREGMDDRLSAAEERGILALVLRHWWTVRGRSFLTGRWTLPGSAVRSCEREAEWGYGFIAGLMRTEEEWGGALSAEERDQLLEPVWRVVNQWESADGAEPLSDEEHAELARELVMAVRAFYEAVRGWG